jgi:allophanate hydrolase
MTAAAFGALVADIAAPLGIGRVRLEDGTNVAGFICEAIEVEGATDITGFDGWRAYRQSLSERMSGRPWPEKR